MKRLVTHVEWHGGFELKSRCTNLLKNDPEFTWTHFYEEIKNHAPTLLLLFLSATKTRRSRPNRKAVIGTCTAILLKYRYY